LCINLLSSFKKRFKQTEHMNHNKTLALILAGMTVGFTTQAGTVWPADIVNNSSPIFTTADGLLTLKAYSDSASTMPLNLGTGGNYIGTGNHSAMSGTQTMTVQLAPGIDWTGFGDTWTRAFVTISGFTSDPGLNVGANPAIISNSYSDGVVSLNLNWNSGGIRHYTFDNPAASAGQLLTISLDYATGPQVAFTEFDYAPVPEPSVAALGLLGGLAAFASARRFRSLKNS
jgi:hypothetical protein